MCEYCRRIRCPVRCPAYGTIEKRRTQAVVRTVKTGYHPMRLWRSDGIGEREYEKTRKAGKQTEGSERE